MADGRVIIETKLDTAGLTQGAKTAKSTVENLGKSMESAGKQSNTLDSGIQGVTASLKTLETIAKSTVVVKLASKAMQLIGDIADETGVVVEKMKAASTLFGGVAVDETNLLNQLYRISSETGESMEVLGQSVYDALSASVEPTRDMANVLNVVSNSAKLAKGGFTDTSTALSATLTVINAYKKDLSELDSVQSMLLQTQNKGVTTVGELGDALATVTPTAASFGVEFADIAASIALMTKQGTKTRVATTALAQVISELGKSGTTASDNLKSAAESAGLAETSFKDLLEKGYSLGQILEIINQYAQENNKSMVDMFSSVEAGRATLQLVGDNAQDFDETLESMNGSAGLVQVSFEKTVDQSERLSAAWATLKSSIGMKLQPTVATLQSGLAGVIEKMTGQEMSAGDLSTALSDFETATKAADEAQKALKESLDSTTQSQYQQTYATLLTSVQNLSDAYNNVVKQMNRYDNAATEANSILAENRRRSEEALKEAQKFNEELTFEELIKQLVEWENGWRDLAEIFPYTAEQQRDALAKSVLYVAQAEKLASSADDVAESWQKAVDDYVSSMAKMVNEGAISINTLRSINSGFADAVEASMKKASEAVEETVEDTTTVTESAITLLIKDMNALKEEVKDVFSDASNTLSNGNLLSDEQVEQLQKYIQKLEDMATRLKDNGFQFTNVNAELEKANELLSDNDVATAVKEMNDAYDEIIDKADKLADKQDALGNAMMTWEDVLDELNELYIDLATKYGTASKACTELADRIEKLGKAHSAEITPLEKVEKAYQKIIDKSVALTGKKDALGNTIRTEKDDVEDLNKLYVEMVETYGEASDAAVWLKKKIDSLNSSLSDGTDEWKEFRDACLSALKGAGQSLAQGIGSAIEDLVYQLFTIDEQIAAIDEKIAAVAEKEKENIASLTSAEKELADAKARGNAKDIDSAEKKLARFKETQEALKKEKKSLEENRKATESGADAWKSASKVALEALASTLESLGAQLAAQAVVQLVSWNFAMAATATAGSVAAFVAAAGIKAAAAKYETGGIVGGSSRHGDQILARVNSGELILNAAQQENLARIIEAAAVLAQANGGGNGITVNFEGVSFYGLDEPAVGKAIYENIKTLQYEGVIR